MKVKELENFQNKSGLKGCKWSSSKVRGTETPQSHPYWKLGEFPFPIKDKTEGFQCLGHSNWIICSPLSPFCSENFPTFSLSYWGANSSYPRGLIMGKGNSPNFQYSVCFKTVSLSIMWMWHSIVILSGKCCTNTPRTGWVGRWVIVLLDELPKVVPHVYWGSCSGPGWWR